MSDAEVERDGSTAITPMTTERSKTLAARVWCHELGWVDSGGDRNPLALGIRELTVNHAQAAKLA